jgi:hypothetical protein
MQVKSEKQIPAIAGILFFKWGFHGQSSTKARLTKVFTIETIIEPKRAAQKFST